MAIRVQGTYVSKNKGAKKGKGKSKQKENKFAKKVFFRLRTSTPFPTNEHGMTTNTRIRAKQDIVSNIVGRTFSVNQGDLDKESGITYRKFNFKITNICGNDSISCFNGMELIPNKVSSIVKKWHRLIEADMEITTNDKSIWRIFVIGVTKRPPGSTKKTAYIQRSQVNLVRRVMFDVISEETDKIDVNTLMRKLSTEAIGKEIERRCEKIGHLITSVVKKVKPVSNSAVKSENKLGKGDEKENILEKENKVEILSQ